MRRTGVGLVAIAAAGLTSLVVSATAAAGTMTFRASPVVTPDANSTSVVQDLYEPKITALPGAAGKPVLYVTGHAIGAYTTRAPAFLSTDLGATWTSMPGLPPGSGPLPGGGHVGGDEGIIVGDPYGHSWMFDNGAEWAGLYGWSAWGGAESEFNPNAYDVGASLSQDCQNTGVDRPWLAYGGGDPAGNAKLLLVNNGFLPVSDPYNGAFGADSSQLQLGLYDTTTNTATWNMCASQGWIPGVPAVRTTDHAFSAPQLVRPNHQTKDGWTLGTVLGDLDKGVGTGPQPVTRLFDVKEEELACADDGGGGNWGWSAYDADGNLYTVGARNDDTIGIAVQPDGKKGFHVSSLGAGGKLWYLWISGSQIDDGALVTWAESKDCEDEDGNIAPVDFYAAHVSPKGGVSDKSLVAKDVEQPCGDYHGSSLGPDGNAYVVTFSSPTNCGDLPPGNHPLTAYIQTGGPRR